MSRTPRLGPTPTSTDPVELVPAVVRSSTYTREDGGQPQATTAAVAPTQLRRPWRSTLRSAFQFAVALATLAPFLVAGVYAGDDYPVIVLQVLSVASAITRVMALPQVEEFLRRFAPFLAAAPAPSSSSGR